MPPYKPVVSNAQRRKLFALANRGEISHAEAEGKARAAKGRDLPERVGPRRRSSRGKSRR
jgi:hypothetical protein